MAIIIKSLKDDQLAATTTTSASTTYSPPFARTAVVRNIRLANADVAPAAVKVDSKVSVGSRDSTNSPTYRRVSPIDVVVPGNGMHVITNELTLSSGDEVRVTLLSPASGTTKLDVVISGMERSV